MAKVPKLVLMVVTTLLLGFHGSSFAQTEMSVLFRDSGQRLGASNTAQVVLADLDGDGDSDLFAANENADRVWFNDGSGTFTDSGVGYGDSYTSSAALADLDGDGDVDAFVAGPNHVWFNDGRGNFAAGEQIVAVQSSTDAIATGDLDDDTDMDIYFGNRDFSNAPDEVWLNDGTGVFVDSGQQIGFETSNKVALGDIDDDGDLDALVATCGNFNEDNKVWLNDGSATFSDSGQALDTLCSAALGLGDLDGDGDLDTVIGNAGSQSGDFTVWTNDGTGQFSKLLTMADDENHTALALADLDVDGDPDLIFGYGGIWLNDGAGGFSRAEQTLPAAGTVATADLDGDGDEDVVLGFGSGANQVWLNESLEPTAITDIAEPGARTTIFLPLIGH